MLLLGVIVFLYLLQAKYSKNTVKRIIVNYRIAAVLLIRYKSKLKLIRYKSAIKIILNCRLMKLQNRKIYLVALFLIDH